MSKPGGPSPDAEKPQLHDTAPPRSTGVPVERDPVSGRLLSGDPLGRQDKGRSARSPGKTALITAGALVVIAAAVVVAIELFTGGHDPEPTATAGNPTQPTTSAAPTTTTPAAETGPRDIPLVLTLTEVVPPPGFDPEPSYGTPGQAFPQTWTISGPCDGTGPCRVESCIAPGECSATFDGVASGDSYTATFTESVQWAEPECTGGTIDNTIMWTFGTTGDDVTVTGTWIQTSPQVLITGSDGRDCGIFLRQFQLGSS